MLVVCPSDTENKDTLYTHIGTLGPIQPPKYLHKSTFRAPGS